MENLEIHPESLALSEEIPSLPKEPARVPLMGWLLLLACIVLESAAQLFYKMSATSAGTGLSDLDFISAAVGSNWALLGYVCMALQFPVWLGVLARMDLSLAFPLTSLSQVTILVGSVLLLSEHVDSVRLVGIGAILIGTMLVVGDEAK